MSKRRKKPGDERASQELAHIGLMAKPGAQLDERAVADVGLVFSKLVDEGRGTAAALVEAASDPGSPAHAHFTWDDKEAAHQHRLNEARAYIRALVVVNPKISPQPVRAFWPVAQRYKRIEAIVEDVDLMQSLVARAKADMDHYVQRYAQILDIAQARGIMEEAFAKLKRGA